ncbi:hypothetical protein RND71_043619 [Anisodus tanguticus]|uniref:ENTH domain-containing protein n=1 Tax=Anisodus tanguticus TaxID=243964 RepID=A0AAE1QP57_9SOLA|nr:hypothetical protein RND71_043619 [Anisodus tanguticus]
MATTGGQTLNDRLNAARYAIAGQGLARAVCKATTEELLAPKKKHLDYLLQCTFEANVSIPQMANFLIERTSHNSWVVVFKALITVHHLMCYGNERFTQYLASSNCSFQLSNFLDKTGVKGYEMSTFIRRYAKYLNEKALSYRLVALDFAKMKRGKEEGSLRTMSKDKLLKTLPILQNQVDALLEFDSNPMDLNNRVIEAAFMLLFRDLIRLFACYNDGIINLLEKYFEMQRKQCREALDLYKKFLIRMDKVGEFLKCAESFGIDKGDIPDLTKAPSSLLEALEQHLNALEAKGKRHKDKSSKEHSEQTKDHSEYSKSLNPEDENLKKALEEEAAMMNQLKEKHVKDKPFNPFLDTSSDLTSFETSASSSTTQVSKNSSNDIIDLFGPSGTTSTSMNPFASGFAQPSTGMSNQPGNNTGASAKPFEPNFASAFGSTSNTSNGAGDNPFLISSDNDYITSYTIEEPTDDSSKKEIDESTIIEFNGNINDEEKIKSPIVQEPEDLNKDSLDTNNNINDLTDKLDSNLSVDCNTTADLSPMLNCPPSSPFNENDQ